MMMEGGGGGESRKGGEGQGEWQHVNLWHPRCRRCISSQPREVIQFILNYFLPTFLFTRSAQCPPAYVYMCVRACDVLSNMYIVVI